MTKFLCLLTNQDTTLLCFYLNALTVHNAYVFGIPLLLGHLRMREGGHKKPCS